MSTPKFRKSQWLDTKTNEIIYGIEIKPEPNDHWFNCHENGKPLLFENEKARDDKLADLKRNQPTHSP